MTRGVVDHEKFKDGEFVAKRTPACVFLSRHSHPDLLGVYASYGLEDVWN